jgi:hypothetical protein
MDAKVSPPPDSVAAGGTEPAGLPVTLHVNGTARELEVEPWVTLLDLLRERLGLTGTKKGCDHGQCGACTVLLDGQRINSCLTLAVMQNGRHITTVEGLAARANCTLCSARSWPTMRCSAATAPRARSARPSASSAKARRARWTTCANS